MNKELTKDLCSEPSWQKRRKNKMDQNKLRQETILSTEALDS